MIEVAGFWLLALSALLGAGLLLRARRVLHAGCWLLLSLTAVSGLLVLLRAPFVAALQLAVAMGSVLLLLLVGLTVRRPPPEPRQPRTRDLTLGALVGFTVLLAAGYPIFSGWRTGQPLSTAFPVAGLQPGEGESIEALGRALCGPDLGALVLVTALLLATLVGALQVMRSDPEVHQDG